MDIVSLYNNALGKVGTRTTVSSTTEGSNESNTCNVFYESSRDATLRAIPWNFARKQAVLTQLKSSADVPNTVPAPWAYEYAYPSDCVKARFLLPQAAAAAQVGGVPLDSAGLTTLPQALMGPPVKFVLGMDEDSSGNPIRVLLTNQFQAQLIYTVRVTDLGLWDPMFAEAMACVLAANICFNITADKALKAQLQNEAKAYLMEAGAANGNEAGLEVINSTPDWIRVRGFNEDIVPFSFADFDTLFQVA